MPFVLQLVHLELKLGVKDVPGVEGVVLKDIVHRQEDGLVVLDDAGIGAYLGLAVREGVQGVDGLVRRNIGGKMDDDFHLVGGHVVNLLDVDFLLVLGLDYAVDDALGGFSVRDFRDGDGGFVHLVDACAHLHHAAAFALVVLRAVRDASGREVRQEVVGLILQYGN